MQRFLTGILIFVVLATGAIAGLAQAADVLNVDSRTVVTDLAPYRSQVATDQAKLSIRPPGDSQNSGLESVGTAPVYYWSYYSIRNSSDIDLSFQLAFEHQGFPGSGILSTRPAGAQIYQALITNPTRPMAIERYAASDNVAIALKPGQSISIALQSVSPDFTAELYPQTSMDRFLVASGFFRGAVLGIAALTFIGMMLAYVYRPNRPTLVALFFALLAISFILFEQGNYPPLPLSPAVMGALLESWWAASLALCVVFFTDARKNATIAHYLGLGVGGILLANSIFGFIEPARASTFARVCFALLVVAGFLLTLGWRKSTTAIVDRGLFFWTLLMGWTLFAALAALQTGSNAVLSPTLTGFLVVVLVVLALELVRYIFANGLAAKPFITDQSRRSLALASAGHSMWDFRIDEGTLQVSEDLPRMLGYSMEEWSENARWLFEAILDPLDLKAYELEVEQAGRRPGGLVERDLRLRDAEGRWRWFHLKARTMPGSILATERCIGTLTEITGLKLAEARQATDSLTDPVTGLPNRSLFMDRLQRELGKPSGAPVRVMMIEIDSFKSLNESLGQENGDKLLQATGARIVSAIEPDETVARLSGGQFAVLLIDEKDRREVKAFADHIAEELAQSLNLPHYLLNLNVNIGFSHSGKKGTPADELIQQAGVALLEAGHRKRDHVVAYDSSMKDERAAQLSLEADLHNAVKQDEIEVYFQPICDLATGVVAGYEALARWRHPKLGLLPPQQFIDMAERVGLIGDIGDIVLSQAARQLGIWQRVARQNSSFFVSVNVSVTHLMEDRFMDRIKTVMERESLVPSTLKIEITESVIMRQPERVLHIMGQLGDLGIGLACDDFGTGFSSLSSLRDLPFDVLKLDRSFIAHDILDERSTLIISAIADMAHDLGMLVVAEGIERQEQIDVLSELGCDLGQGYLIGMAQTAKAVSETLTTAPRYVAPTPRVPAPPQQVEIAPIIQREQSVFASLTKPENNIDKPEIVPAPDNTPPKVLPESLPSLFAMQKVPAQEKPQLAPPKRPSRLRKRPARTPPPSP